MTELMQYAQEELAARYAADIAALRAAAGQIAECEVLAEQFNGAEGCSVKPLVCVNSAEVATFISVFHPFSDAAVEKLRARMTAEGLTLTIDEFSGDESSTYYHIGDMKTMLVIHHHM